MRSSSTTCRTCATLPTAIIVSIAGSNHDEFVAMAAQLDGRPGVAAIELNISCPNVAHGVDFGADPGMCGRLVAAVPRGDVAADHRQADAERDEHRDDRPGRRRRRAPMRSR